VKRISVPIHTQATGYCKAKATRIEAYCKRCCAWKRSLATFIDSENPAKGEIPSHRGQCHRYPKKVNKHQDDWCGEFRPELKPCESED